MPRRRMIDPDFWNDSRVKKLPPVERLLLIGMISNADDEGRLLAHPAYLRSKIFPYDDFTLEEIGNMRDHIVETNPNIQLYQNATEDYMCFRQWPRYQKPSHPQPSKLPPPPELSEQNPEPITESIPEQNQNEVRTIPSQVRSGQSSLGKVSIGQVRAVQEEFTEYLNNEKDLTDFLTMTLTKYLPRGPTWLVAVLEKLWEQALGQKMKQPIFEATLNAVRNHPPVVLARAYVKAVKYQGGKFGSPKYLEKILEEQSKKHDGGAKNGQKAG